MGVVKINYKKKKLFEKMRKKKLKILFETTICRNAASPKKDI